MELPNNQPDNLTLLRSPPDCEDASYLATNRDETNGACEGFAKWRYARGEQNGMHGKGHLVAGEKQDGHKLTWNSVQLIRLLAAAGAPYRVIAKRCGVTSSAICYVVRGRNWRENVDELRMMEEYFLAMLGK